MKLERWNFGECCKNKVTTYYGGWVKLCDLPLKFWNTHCLKAIGTQLCSSLNISSKTLNLLDVSAAMIQGEKNASGFILHI